MRIQTANTNHYNQIDDVIARAFKQADEATLVRALRGDGAMAAEFVMVEGTDVLGHIAFSVMSSPQLCLGMAPVSVMPAKQAQGIGGALIRHATAWAQANGWHGIFVLGDPAYYQRFGFALDEGDLFETAYPRSHFMAYLFNPISEFSTREADYAAAFSRL